jgi:hypothetical protein
MQGIGAVTRIADPAISAAIGIENMTLGASRQQQQSGNKDKL